VAFPSRNRRGLERSPRPGARRAARRRPVCAAGCVPLLVPPKEASAWPTPTVTPASAAGEGTRCPN